MMIEDVLVVIEPSGIFIVVCESSTRLWRTLQLGDESRYPTRDHRVSWSHRECPAPREDRAE